jgi:hypothetical protein
MTIMSVLIAKEAITNKKVLWIMLANTFTINYLALHGLKHYSQIDKAKEGGTQGLNAVEKSILGVRIL